MSYFLSCDPLQSNECITGDYVIEWRLNARDGEIVFVSGEGSDPAIQAQHPLIDEVVFAGTLYPIIRYAYLNGLKYTAEFEEGSLYSPDFITCLDPIVVDEVSCDTVLGSDSNYNYYLEYNNVNDVGEDKSRTIKYNISDTTRYIAWRFRAFDVSEQLKIYYCTVANPDGTLIDNFIIGRRNSTGGNLITDLYSGIYPTDPRVFYDSNYVYYISNLTSFTYTVGDYIKVEIVGSILEPSNTNTNWNIAIQCFDSIDNSFYSTDISKISSPPSMAYSGDPSCYYNLTYNTLEEFFPLTKTANLYFLFRYTDLVHSYSFNPVSNYPGANPFNISLRWKNLATTSYFWFGTGHTTCMDLGEETVSISKVDNEFSFTFSDITDYNSFVSNITSIQSDPDYATWEGITDTTDVKYYGYYQVYYTKGTTCGDVISNYYFYFWLGCDISYDELNKTVTFIITVPTNDLTLEECDESYSIVNTRIVSFTNTLNFNIQATHTPSNVRAINMVSALWSNITATEEITRSVTSYLYIEEAFVNGIFDPISLGFCYNALLRRYEFYRADDRLTLKTYSTHDERLYDWKLERKVRLRTDNCEDNTYETVYEGPGTTTSTTTTP